MRESVYKVFTKYSNWKNILLLFAIFISLKLAFDLHVSPKLKNLTGGFDAPDIVPFYDVNYIKDFLTLSNQDGLNYYLSYFFVVDIFFPLAGALFFCLLLSAILKRLFSMESILQYLVLLPMISTGFDWIESVSIVFAILNLPDISLEFLSTISKFSMLKIIFGVTSLVLVLALAIGLLFKKMRRT